MRNGYVDTDFGQLHYREAGSGDPLILFHKTPSSSVMYSRVMPIFAEHYRVIAPDNLGFGMSNSLPTPSSTMEPYRLSSLQLMDALGIERASVLGHSTGATIALEIAAHQPDRVDKLVIASFAANEHEDDLEALVEKLQTGVAPTFGQPVKLDARGDYLEEFPLGALRRMITRDDPEQFLMELIAYLQSLPNYGWAAGAVFAIPGPYALFPKLRCPVLIVNSTEGFIYENTKKAAPHIPNSTYIELPGTSEFIVDDPEPFAEVVLDFLGPSRGQ